jgi:hypothetical protein
LFYQVNKTHAEARRNPKYIALLMKWHKLNICNWPPATYKIRCELSKGLLPNEEGATSDERYHEAMTSFVTFVSLIARPEHTGCVVCGGETRLIGCPVLQVVTHQMTSKITSRGRLCITVLTLN